MKKRETKLYNVIFPVWLLYFLYPPAWLISLPANFLIDSLVLVLAMKCLGITEKWGKYKKAILKVWGLGFLADLIGAVWLFLPGFILNSLSPTKAHEWFYHNLYAPVFFHPFSSLAGFLWVALGVALAGLLVYIFNLKISFKKLNLEAKQKKRLALSLAICTAPYLFFLPTKWFL